jgi:pyruvate dehydrogenase E2 component (dihydrolipoamide acetyltransferase)
MPISVVMPALEMAQETGKLISWLKKEGESVAKGEPLLEVETDKAVMEVESPGEGVLAGVKVQVGAEVPVGRTIAWILKPGETVPSTETEIESGRKATATKNADTPPAASARTSSTEGAKVSPKARRLASEKGVDLSQLRGSGPQGEILAADILAAAGAVAPVSESSSPVARLMAQRTTESWTTVPHFFLVREVDADALIALRDALRSEVERSTHIKLTYTDLLIALVSRVLRKHSRMNASWDNGSLRHNSDINISLAVAVEGGVVAPVIHRADLAALSEIAARRSELANRAKAGKLRPSDIAGGTFTISNLGMFAIDAFTAIITPPQAAVLAVGRIADRVIATEGRPMVRPMMTLTLSCDHRVADGAYAAEFLGEVADAIRDPQQMLT